MHKPLIDVAAILDEENKNSAAAEGNAWGLVSIEQVRHSGAEAIVDIITAAAGGDTVHFVSNGAWSQHELLLGALDITGPARMYVSTYAMSETSARCINGLLKSGLLTEVNAVIDNRIDKRSPGSLQLLKKIAKNCVLVACHSKITVLEGSMGCVLILGSANYTENKRIETGIVSTDARACKFHKAWILETIRDGQ